MSVKILTCPECGAEQKIYSGPSATVDAIIEYEGGIVLIERQNEPFGWALPGGFVDEGESVETAVVRETLEETSLELSDIKLLNVYSDPQRDPRQHTLSVVFVGQGEGLLRASDDAANAEVFSLDQLPANLCFDHAQILSDYRSWKNGLLLK